MATTPTHPTDQHHPTDRPHPLTARMWQRMSADLERKGAAGFRRELLAGLTGRVVEVGAGNGATFAHYPAGVTEVVAVEPEPYLRARAHEAAAGAPVPVTVVPGVAGALPGGDGEFDAAVTALVLCTVPDVAGALAEIGRVLRPGGELRFWEHVVARKPGFARFQRVWDVFWVRASGWGCHAARDTGAAIAGAGFEVERLRRFAWKASVLDTPMSPHILGVARRPAELGPAESGSPRQQAKNG